MNTKDYFQEIGAWPKHSHSLLRMYAIGFILSLALTLGAYFLAMDATVPGVPFFITLLTLACTQFIVQILCFLHLGGERSSRDRLIVLGAACLIVFILVAGSLWIMTHLNARMMADPAAMQQYMDDQAGI
jgi:cytochrome o ubiquinol oxidase operon protein cyoD